MSREEVIDLEILKYEKIIEFDKIEKHYEEEVKDIKKQKKKEYYKNKKYLSHQCKGSKDEEIFSRYKKYKKLKSNMVAISKEEKVDYIISEYTKFIEKNYTSVNDKILFLKTKQEYFNDEIGGIKGKDTNLSITYWLGIIVGLACSILSSIFIEQYGNEIAIVLVFLLAIIGFREIYKSAYKDNFKYYSLIAIESLLQEMCKDNSTNFELRRIENKLDIIEKQIDCFGEKRSSKNSFFDLFANRRIKR